MSHDYHYPKYETQESFYYTGMVEAYDSGSIANTAFGGLAESGTVPDYPLLLLLLQDMSLRFSSSACLSKGFASAVWVLCPIVGGSEFLSL